MKRYTVIWDNVVESNFLDAWVKSDSCARAALTELAGTIDRALAVNADVKGEQQPAEGTRAVDVRVAASNYSKDVLVQIGGVGARWATCKLDRR